MNNYTEYNKTEKKVYRLTSKYLYSIIHKALQMKQKAKLILEMPYDDKQSVRADCELSLKKKG